EPVRRRRRRGQEAMSTVDLLQPVRAGGVQRNNFFNGRLLSAEDLRAEQEANRARHRQRANATGDGVARGMEVSVVAKGPGSPTGGVTGGLALNRCGDLLALGEKTTVALVPAAQPGDVAAGLLAECGCEGPATTDVLTAEGVYVLVVSPA